MKPIVMFCLFSLFINAQAQNEISVTRKSNRIKGNNAIGYSLEIAGKSETVEASLTKFLKDYGKTRSMSDYVTVSGPFLGGITYEGKSLYAKTEGNDSKSTVWVGLDTAEWKGEDVNKVLDRVNKLVYQFGVKYYRDLSQKDIDESQEAFDATEKQKVRLTNQNKDLNIRLSNNEQERIHLQKALEANALEKAVILQKIENNKRAQDSVANVGLQIKKVLDGKKEKQKKIN